MRLAIVTACFTLLIGVPVLTGVPLTKTGPALPSPVEILEHGGGGGP